jgi:hypothetical protein
MRGQYRRSLSVNTNSTKYADDPKCIELSDSFEYRLYKRLLSAVAPAAADIRTPLFAEVVAMSRKEKNELTIIL